MRGRSRGLVLAAAAGLALGAAAPGAAAQEGELDRVDSLAASGQIAEARQALQGWWDRSWDGAERGRRQHALWLRGILTVDPDQAGRDYQRLALEYPGGSHTARALLRLGQADHARGRLVEAADHMEQLVRDYPGTPPRLEARRWLREHAEAVAAARRERARADAGPAPAGSGAPEEGADEPGEPPAEDAARTEVAREVDEVPASPSEEAAAPDPAPSDRSAPSPADTAAPAAGGAERGGEGAPPEAEEPARLPVAVQLGAFSGPERARSLARRARERGVDVRLVRIPGSGLVRVRAGFFPSRAAARDLRARVRGMGLEAVIVTDADRETPIQ